VGFLWPLLDEAIDAKLDQQAAAQVADHSGFCQATSWTLRVEPSLYQLHPPPGYLCRTAGR
jgi:hypothetical protein